ncbi:MAG: VOC family protein [Pseudomonadota bacterium]|uniref:VOC family protein n=1 Tax=Sphingomonas sp. ERG5 TaxID=1381597 RepID=UPI001364A73A|nr:VOC family protein [Sphingomonas sp. ERG5]
MKHAISLSHLNLPVTDLERSMDFYVRKLGFHYVRHLRPGKVILEVGGFDFFLEEGGEGFGHPRFHFGFETTTDGVHEFARLIEDRGISQVVGPQPTGRAELYVTPDGLRTVFYFADPDGHIIEVYSHIGVDVGYVDPAYAAQMA